jgi:hypothetical protein
MLRLILIFLILFLIARIFFVMGSNEPEGQVKEPVKEKASKKTGVPKELGEYIEFEEVKGKG